MSPSRGPAPSWVPHPKPGSISEQGVTSKSLSLSFLVWKVGRIGIHFWGWTNTSRGRWHWKGTERVSAGGGWETGRLQAKVRLGRGGPFGAQQEGSRAGRRAWPMALRVSLGPAWTEQLCGREGRSPGLCAPSAPTSPFSPPLVSGSGGSLSLHLFLPLSPPALLGGMSGAPPLPRPPRPRSPHVRKGQVL